MSYVPWFRSNPTPSPVIVMRGISGSGKSTLAHKMAKELRAVVVSADDFFMRSGRYEFDPSKLSLAHGQSFRRAIEAAQAGRAIIVDNTNTTISEIAPYMLLAQAYDRPARIITVQCEIEAGVSRTRHGVPRAGIERMHATLAAETKKMPPWWEHEEVGPDFCP